MTAEEHINLKELISRYKAWVSKGVYPKEYYKNYGHWKSEIETHIKYLEQKLKQSLCQK
jgi:hypothetical protein